MSAETPTPRWFEHRDPDSRLDYAYHFTRIAERGDDIDGEARFMDAMADRGATILDAGCGTGRVAHALARAGHRAAGVDTDPTLIEKGREFYPGLPLAHLDLYEVTRAALAERGLPEVYDLIVCPGNVMHFVAPQSEGTILRRLAGVLRPGGRAVFGFRTDGDYTVDGLDRDATAAGWALEQRFGTWQLDAFTAESDWAVSVFRAAG